MSFRTPGFLSPLLIAVSACGGIRIQDVVTPRPIPRDSCLVVGFLGGRDAWNDETKGVRQLALELRRRGFFTETFENRRRGVALELVRGAAADRLVLYGQSFGGAAVAHFSRELETNAVAVELTVQIDSVGRGDGALPANVRNAANLFQTNGWFLDGEHPIRASDPSRTRILGNWRFDYSEPPGSEISLEDVPWWKLIFRIPHARMDRDPHVWSFTLRLIEAACTGGDMKAIEPSSRLDAMRGPSHPVGPLFFEPRDQDSRLAPGAQVIYQDAPPVGVAHEYRSLLNPDAEGPGSGLLSLERNFLLSLPRRDVEEIEVLNEGLARRTVGEDRLASAGDRDPVRLHP